MANSTRLRDRVDSRASRSQPHPLLKAQLRFLVAVVVVIAAFPSIGGAAATQDTCVQTGPESLAYKMHLCLISPDASGVVSGVVTVTSEASIDGTDPGTRRVIFYLDGDYVLTDYQSPYTFQLDTSRYPNGPHKLEVEYVMRDAFVTSRAAETLNIENSSHPVSQPTATFRPSTGRPVTQGQQFVVAVAGDGAGGEKNEASVTDMISTWDPNLVLYLGDVYDHGSPSEFDNWYGAPNSLFGRFRDITDPVVGNHEYQTPDAAGYFGYWDGVPHYYSFDAGGWHFIALDSTTEFKETSPGTAQYEWLQHDLAANKSVCTLVFLHHPFYSVGEHGNSPQLKDIWPLLVSNGVDLVLSGHDHSYQRWQPLGTDGNPDPKGTTQFVVGTGGHSLRNNVETDPNLVVTVDTPSAGYGALRLSLTPSSANFEFQNIKGKMLDSGTVNCSTPGARSGTALGSSVTPVSAIGTTNGTQRQNADAETKSGIGIRIENVDLIPAILILVLLAAGVALGFAMRVAAEDSD